MTEDDIAKWAKAKDLLQAITDELNKGVLHHSINGIPLCTPEEVLAALIEDGVIVLGLTERGAILSGLKGGNTDEIG